MIQEFVCPNGRMSVNGVCPIFEGDDGQIKDMNKGIFEFDFDKPTESTFQSADNIINQNINAYRNFVEDKLGISPKTQEIGTALSIFGGLASGGGFASIIGPFAIPFIAGSTIRKNQEKIKQRNLNIDAGIQASDNDDNMGYTTTQQQAGPGFSDVTEAGSF